VSGKHADVRTPRLSRNKFVPLISAVTLAGVLVGGATAAMSLGPATDGSSSTAAQAAAGASSVSPSPSGQASRSSDSRASRSGLRAMPSPPASSPSPSPTKASPRPTQPSGGGAVTSSGTCGASFYSDGQRTANGETFDPNAFTAANKTMPFNTRVKVTNPSNGKSVVVRINDRGPFVSGRCLDLSRAAFTAIASTGSGVITVRYEVLS
jgi:rare lipoprotein A